jgi:dipeptidyl aminopeptidase/acylaminoacyl peptidase
MARPIEPEDLFRFRFVVGADLSADGARVAYATTRVGKKDDEDTEFSDLNLLDVASGESRRLTFSDSTNNAPSFSPDGEMIAFTSSRGEKPQLYLLPVAGGEARQLTDLKQGVGGGAAWSPDGKTIAFTAGPAKEPRDQSKPYRIDRAVWRFDMLGNLDDAVQDVYVVDVESGESLQLTDDRFMNSMPKWTADGKAIAYLASHDPDDPRMASRLRTVDLDKNVTDLTGVDGMIMGHAPTPDGKFVYLLSRQPDKPIGSKPSLIVLDPATGEHAERGTSIEGHIGAAIQGDNPSLMLGMMGLHAANGGRDAVVPVQNGGEVSIVKVALSGEEAVVTIVDGNRVCAPVAVRGDKLLFGAFGFTEPGDLYLASVQSGEERRLTRLNEELLAQLELPEVVNLHFPSKDGAQVEGWFLKPVGADGPVPTILGIHGGPHAGWGAHFHFDHLMLSGAGYGIVMVNHRASTGYGEAFSTAIKGDWGNLDFADLMAGVDHAIDLDLADGDRLGVFGVSGGGNLTGWVIGHTDRFKAACPENPVFSWLSFYGTSDIGHEFGVAQMGGTPDEVLDTYIRCSPLTSAHLCTTPTLFFQHEADYRCPAEQTEQYYTVLRVKGVPAEMVRFPNTAHGGSSMGPIGHRRAQNDALLDWMNRWVLGRQPAAAEAEPALATA